MRLCGTMVRTIATNMRTLKKEGKRLRNMVSPFLMPCNVRAGLFTNESAIATIVKINRNFMNDPSSHARQEASGTHAHALKLIKKC
jgi:hypothetical protein